MRKILSNIFVFISALILALGLYSSFVATNDCDLGDIIVMMGLAGVLCLLLAAVIRVGLFQVSLKSSFVRWSLIIALGFFGLFTRASYLNRTSVGDCSFTRES